MLLAAVGREIRHAAVAKPKHVYYFVLESAGSMAGERPAEAALLNMATYDLSGHGLTTMACVKFFPKIVNTVENTALQRCGKRRKSDDGFRG
jgi:hypothetical protein